MLKIVTFTSQTLIPQLFINAMRLENLNLSPLVYLIKHV
jgi:hypothetical protein